MPRYILIAKINQIVTKEIQLHVTAGSEEEAEDKARQALQVYPKPVECEGIERMVTTKSNYWIPRDIEIITLKEEKPVD